jgi:hypothetical protein
MASNFATTSTISIGGGFGKPVLGSIGTFKGLPLGAVGTPGLAVGNGAGVAPGFQPPFSAVGATGFAGAGAAGFLMPNFSRIFPKMLISLPFPILCCGHVQSHPLHIIQIFSGMSKLVISSKTIS